MLLQLKFTKMVNKVRSVILKRIMSFLSFTIVLSVVCFFSFGCDDTTSSDNSNDVPIIINNFVNAAWLKDNVANENIIIVDARDYSTAYIQGHIPSAISTQWQFFANTSVQTTEVGFGELLSASEIAEKIAGLGISAKDTVIVYAAANVGWGEAGRITWMLQMAGIEAKILDGGINAWSNAGYSLETNANILIESDFSISSLDASFTISTSSLNENKNTIIILDTRSKAEFDGDTSSYGALDNYTHGGWGEKAFGHIPGAKHAPFTDMFKSDGTLKSTADLETLVSTWGLADKSAIIAPYCTGGIRSAYMAIVLRELGFTKAVNYDASFYGWTAADLEVE